MRVAGATVHWENGFMSAKDGIELNFIYAILAIGVATIGPGEYSLDHALCLIEDLDGVTGLLIAAVGGVGAALRSLRSSTAAASDAADQPSSSKQVKPVPSGSRFAHVMP